MVNLLGLWKHIEEKFALFKVMDKLFRHLTIGNLLILQHGILPNASLKSSETTSIFMTQEFGWDYISGLYERVVCGTNHLPLLSTMSNSSGISWASTRVQQPNSPVIPLVGLLTPITPKATSLTKEEWKVFMDWPLSKPSNSCLKKSFLETGRMENNPISDNYEKVHNTKK
jgi:hypothetical protein